jgi:hypothetical protein
MAKYATIPNKIAIVIHFNKTPIQDPIEKLLQLNFDCGVLSLESGDCALDDSLLGSTVRLSEEGDSWFSIESLASSESFLSLGLLASPDCPEFVSDLA